jgi:XTP/dITP diphosphohydrolase
MKRLAMVTTNPHKAAEIAPLLGAEWVLWRPTIGEVAETADTFAGNATLKAEAGLAVAERVMAEDSGLEVRALQGAPGVYSKRYGATDAERIARVLAGLADATDRSARFVAVVALATRGEPTRLFEGTVEGEIALEPRGAHGFGYDPIFIPREGDGRTFAEMTKEEKSALSHRGRALRELVAYLQRTAPEG